VRLLVALASSVGHHDESDVTVRLLVALASSVGP
jgi:hypothetical protein